MISVDFLGDGTVIVWKCDDEEDIISRILNKYCSKSVGRRITMRMICDGIGMKKSATFDIELLKDYTGRFFARLKLYAGVLATIGMKDQLYYLMDGMYPKHYVKLLWEKILHLQSGRAYGTVCLL